MPMIPFLVAAVIVSLIAAVSDWKTGQIPNWLTLPVIVLAPIVHAAMAAGAGMSREEVGWAGASSVVGAMLTGLVPLILYRQNAIGGGDLKLLAALGALCQPSLGLELEMYGFATAIVVAPARLAYDGKLLRTLRNTLDLMLNSIRPEKQRKAIEPEAMTWFRLGPCIFIGVCVTTAFHWGSK